MFEQCYLYTKPQAQERSGWSGFWPDHFFGDLMKFIIDICARAVTDGVPYARTYYSRTTSKVLPTPLKADIHVYSIQWFGNEVGSQINFEISGTWGGLGMRLVQWMAWE